MARVELRGVRPSAIAGSWYPGSEPALRRTVQGYLDNAPVVDLPAPPLGLIVPHAGYMYSGQIAAHAYKQVSGHSYDTVIIISPIHRGYLPMSGAALTAAAAYSTPLGEVPLNADMVAALDDRLRLSLLRRDEEHSLEIQIPFLQVALGSFDLLPVMMADQSLAFAQELGDAIAGIVRDSKRNVLIVASTDLSHFHSYESARRLDQVMLDHVNAYDIAGLAQALERGKTEACGGGPVLAALIAGRALGATSARILNYANSGDVTGDRSRVVGYAAGVILRP
jgi:AmmeMemoRadiSam system protein B